MNPVLRFGAIALLLGGTLAVPRHASAADDVTLTLTEQPFAIAAGTPFSATFDVAGDVPAATPATTVPVAPTAPSPDVPASSAPTATAPPVTSAPVVEARVLAHRPVDDRADLTAALDGAAGVVVSRLTTPVSLVDTGAATSSFTITVPTSTGPDIAGTLVLSRAGTYPVTIDLVVDGEVVATHETFLERLAAVSAGDNAPMHLAVVATVGDPGPAPSANAHDATRAAAIAVAGSAAVLGGSMSVLLPPALLAGLDETTLGGLRESLAGSELVSVPALALDPSSAVAAGEGVAFSRELRRGEDLLVDALGTMPRRSAWSATSELSAPAAATLREPLGFDAVVFDPDVYSELDGSIGGYHDATLGFAIDVGDGATLHGLVVHPASRWLDPEDLADRDMSGTDGAIAILAELRVTRQELGEDLRRGAVLAAPTDVAPDPGVLRALAASVATVPDTELTTLSALAATDIQRVPGRGPETVRLPATAGADLTERVARIDLTRINATGAGSMLIDQTRPAAWDAELDALLSTALTEAAVDVRLDRISAEAQAIYDCVVTPNPFTLTLTGRSSTLRLNLTNRCDDDLRIVVHPTSSRLEFPAGDVARTLPANVVTEVEIEVESRSNGTSAIGIELLTPVGSLPVREPLILTARVNALSGLGQLVTGGALLVLVSWWYGHFRRRRRARRAMIGEVDNPMNVGPAVSPDAAEVSVSGPHFATTDSVTDP